MAELFSWVYTVEGWVSLFTLTALEIVLGIDNVIFVSIAASKLPIETRDNARRIGLFLAMFLRIALLTLLTWLAGLTDVWFSVFGHGFSKRDLILLGGGLYLVYKASAEIWEMLNPDEEHEKAENNTGKSAFFMVVAQIAVVDVVFAIDSIITAVGMTNHLPIMISAVVIAVIIMMYATAIVSHFVEKHPTTKMLALAFLVFVGGILVSDGLGHHISRTYIYAVIIFCTILEALNIVARNRMEKAALGKLSHVKYDEPRIEVGDETSVSDEE